MLASFLSKNIKEAVRKLYTVELADIKVSAPPPHVIGQFSTSVALQLSKRLGKPAQEIADELISELMDSDEFRRYAQHMGVLNGHINVVCTDTAFCDALCQAYELKKPREKSDSTIVLEYVSANPTGPISVVNGRAGVLGDSLANVLRRVGHRVPTHYYVNDGEDSGQIKALKSTFQHYDKVADGEPSEFPENGYKGDFVYTAWQHYTKMKKESQTSFWRHNPFSGFGIGYLTACQLIDLKKLGIAFDWLDYESRIVETNNLKHAFQHCGKNLNDFTYEKDGALWLKTTEYGDDLDRVVTRNDGTHTYFHNDILYHCHKYSLHRKSRLINIWGADHHGYIPRLNAVMRMLGLPDIEIVLTQMVSLEIEKEDGTTETFMGSKREGQYLLLYDDFVSKVGVDAARWYFLMDNPSNHLTINVSKAAEQSTSNPVYYVQYAHARLCSIIKKSAEAGVYVEGRFANLELNSSRPAVDLILKLDAYQDVLQRAADNLSPQLVKTYLFELAQTAHIYYESERLMKKNTDEWLAGLYLVTATVKVLKDGLKLLGISAPETMALGGSA